MFANIFLQVKIIFLREHIAKTLPVNCSLSGKSGIIQSYDVNSVVRRTYETNILFCIQ